jgi:hypothetical protein
MAYVVGQMRQISAARDAQRHAAPLATDAL